MENNTARCKMINYSLVSGTHSCNQTISKTMFLFGMTDFKDCRGILILIYTLKSLLIWSNTEWMILADFSISNNSSDPEAS